MTIITLQRKDHDMQTLTITPAMRFGAHAYLQAHRGSEAGLRIDWITEVES